jgi:CheY-like chemotaxis protein
MTMTDQATRLMNILVLEDEFIIADEIATMLEDAGHRVVGPAATVDEAMKRIRSGEQIDAAVIDANLRGATSAPVAEELKARGIPFCVCTGYRIADLQKTFGEVVILQKPVTERILVSALSTLLAAKA